MSAVRELAPSKPSEDSMQIIFHTDALIDEGISRGMGYGAVKQEIMDSAHTVFQGYGHLRSITPEPFDPHILDELSIMEYLLKSPFVAKIILDLKPPALDRVKTLLLGLKGFSVDTRLKGSWHHDTIRERFSSDGNELAEAVDNLLVSTLGYDRGPGLEGVLELYVASGLDVTFNPLIRPGSITTNGVGSHPRYSEFVTILDCRPSDMTLEARTPTCPPILW